MSRRVRGLGFCLCVAASLGWGNPLADKNAKGNAEYERGRYAEALSAYAQAMAEDPGQPDVTYNIGNVLYRKGQFEEAAQGYGRALFSDDPRRREEAAYNLANARYRVGNLEEAAAYYKKALEMDENDEDARYNLELILRQMQQQQQQDQQKQQDEQSQGEEQQEQEKQDSSEKKDEQEKDSQESQEPDPSAGADSSRAEPEQMQPGEERQAEMTPEEAERILDALEDEERELRAERKTEMRRTKEVEKDW